MRPGSYCTHRAVPKTGAVLRRNGQEGGSWEASRELEKEFFEPYSKATATARNWDEERTALQSGTPILQKAEQGLPFF